MTARLAASSSSQIRVEKTGQKSLLTLTSASSVQTAAHPPSAFMARKRAWEAGFSLPKPVQCGTA
jgi:hypothetical protein